MTDTYDLRGDNPVRPTILKDPNAILDYTVDWTDWLLEVGDTIASHSFPLMTNGVTVSSSSVIDGTKVTAYVAGGTVGLIATLTCRIVTVGTPTPRTDERTLFFQMRER